MEEYWLEDWKKFLVENENYNQALYNSTWELRIDKKIGGDKTQTLNDIRSIPHITTIYRASEGTEDRDTAYADYNIKFVLKKGESADFYIKQILKPGLQAIPGLTVLSYKGTKRIK